MQIPPDAESELTACLQRALSNAQIPEHAWPGYLEIAAEFAGFIQAPMARWRLVDIVRFFSLRQPLLDDAARARYRSALALFVEMLAEIRGVEVLEREFERTEQAFRDSHSGFSMPAFVRVALDAAQSSRFDAFEDLLPISFGEPDSGVDPEIADFLDGTSDRNAFGQRPSTAARSSTPEFDSAPGSDFGSRPGSGFGSRPGSGFGSRPGSDFRNRPLSGFGSRPPSGAGSRPPSDSTSRSGSGFEFDSRPRSGSGSRPASLARERDAESGRVRPLGFSGGRRAHFSTTNLPAVSRRENDDAEASRASGRTERFQVRWSPAGWGELELHVQRASQEIDRALRVFVEQLASRGYSAAVLQVSHDALAPRGGAAWFLDWLKNCAGRGVTRVGLVSDDATAARLGVGRLEHESSRLGSIKLPTRAEVCAFDELDDARAWLRRVLRR